jgi:hypothetical protein
MSGRHHWQITTCVRMLTNQVVKFLQAWTSAVARSKKCMYCCTHLIHIPQLHGEVMLHDLRKRQLRPCFMIHEKTIETIAGRNTSWQNFNHNIIATTLAAMCIVPLEQFVFTSPCHMLVICSYQWMCNNVPTKQNVFFPFTESISLWMPLEILMGWWYTCFC